MEQEITDLADDLIDDLVEVCSGPPPHEEPLRTGIEIKKRWLTSMLDRYGPVAKIGYLGNRPVAQLLFYPEEADPVGHRREGVLVIQCIYNPSPEAQRKGVASSMLRSLLRQIRGEGKYRFLAVYAFETGEHYSQRDFFLKRGFKQVPEGDREDLYYSLSGEVLDKGVFSPWREVRETYVPRKEDEGWALMFYTPTCEYGYVLASRAADAIREVAPWIEVELVNYWKRPGDFLARGRRWLVVNGIPVTSMPGDMDSFVREVAEAVGLSEK